MSARGTTGSKTESRSLRSRIDGPAWFAAGFTGVVLVVLAVVSVSSELGMYAALVAAALLLGLVTLGLERFAESLVLFGVFLVPMNDLTAPGALSFVTAADGAFLLGFAMMFPDLIRRPLRLPPTFVLGAGGVFTVALISSALSADPAASLNATARLVVGAFALTTLIVWWSPELKKVVAFAWAYVLGNGVSVIYGQIGGPVLPDGRQFGLTEHPNIFGLCSLLAVVLVPFLLSQTPEPRRWMPAAAGLVSVYGIWTSGSRGALAALIAVALIYPLLRRSVVAALLLLAGIVLAVTFSEPLLNQESQGNALSRLVGGGSATGSDQAREDLATEAFNQFQSNPVLGVGLADALAAHVIYLQIAAGVGFLGLAFYLIVLWTTAKPAVSVEPPFNLLALPALSYIALGLVTPVLWDRYIWAALALSLLAPRLASEAKANAETDPTTRPAVADATP